ncbi:hypothetical protein LJC20_04990 [Eubacteriales bacterium OttesenSCG-928-M02]|nr:hypothetical protein [Eubacteriales bacterium OttesenSCG-928-M02]
MDDQRMTTGHGAERVKKDDGLIQFRGGLDELMALCNLLMVEYKRSTITYRCAKQVWERCQALFTKEYTGERVTPIGYDMVGEDAREKSHDPLLHFGVPHFFGKAYGDEPLAKLNLLRVKARQVERLAVAAFGEERADMVEELNRLSSYIYCCMCIYEGNRNKRIEV